MKRRNEAHKETLQAHGDSDNWNGNKLFFCTDCTVGLKSCK